MKELQSLALDVKVLTESGEELIIHELDEDDEAIPNAKAREAEDREKEMPEEELDITGDDVAEDDEIEDISLFESDDDEDGFVSKELFSDEDMDDFGDDDELGDKFTLFDDEDDGDEE